MQLIASFGQEVWEKNGNTSIVFNEPTHISMWMKFHFFGGGKGILWWWWWCMADSGKCCMLCHWATIITTTTNVTAAEKNEVKCNVLFGQDHVIDDVNMAYKSRLSECITGISFLFFRLKNPPPFWPFPPSLKNQMGARTVDAHSVAHSRTIRSVSLPYSPCVSVCHWCHLFTPQHTHTHTLHRKVPRKYIFALVYYSSKPPGTLSPFQLETTCVSVGMFTLFIPLGCALFLLRIRTLLKVHSEKYSITGQKKIK